MRKSTPLDGTSVCTEGSASPLTVGHARFDLRSLGIDVGMPPKWLDVVILDGDLRVVYQKRRVLPEHIPALLASWRPDVVAIDAPPSCAISGSSRAADRHLARLGIHAFPVPPKERASSAFYGWMRVGFQTFQVAAKCGYPRYRAGPVQRTAIEVFPHASAVALAGFLPPSGTRRHRWRREVLAAQGVPVEGIRSKDLVDAAVAALTGVRALEGRFFPVGDPEEGVVIFPVARIEDHFVPLKTHDGRELP